MREDKSPAGAEPATPFMDDIVPASEQLRASLGDCHALIAECGRIVRDADHPPGVQVIAATAAAKLAAASAQAASGIARLADAETRQRLATAKIDSLNFLPRLRRTQRAAAQNAAPFDSRRTSDCEEHDFESEKSTNNYIPRVRNPWA